MTSDDMFDFDAFSELCPSQSTLRDLTGRWVPLVLIALDEGAIRFGEIHRRIGGSSERMIAQTLRVLEGDGFVQRSVDGARPAYSLTDGGRAVAARFRELLDTVYEHLQTQAPERNEAVAHP